MKDCSNQKAKNCPCEGCICNAICRLKHWYDLIRQFQIIREFVSNHYEESGFVPERIQDINNSLSRKFELQLGSYGHKYVVDKDEPQFITRGFREKYDMSGKCAK